ncbi:MAG: CDP-alcohol phosphatidyltransferase family protein [Sphingobacteriia bacterium]|nr:CDP-alcohol phosphatidyltransferase family protein [Sphingobacteriia bacterium]
MNILTVLAVRKNIPNLLTISRIALIPFILLFIVNNYYNLAFFVFLYCALTDFADGYLARKMKAQSSFGAMADAIADKLVILVPGWFIFFHSNHHLSLALLIILTVRDCTITTLRYLHIIPLGSTPSKIAKIKTFLLYVLILFYLFIAGLQWNEWNILLTYFIRGVEIIISALALLSLQKYLTTT